MPGVLVDENDEHGAQEFSSDDNSLLESYCSEGKCRQLKKLFSNLKRQQSTTFRTYSLYIII